MEKNSLSNSLKDHSICNRGSNNNKLKYSWNFNNQSSTGDQDYLGGFSWPPRSYTCSFCKREFRSAQALGGHMNVHRRDRARLRQSPPRDSHCTILNLNTNPNPKPNSVSPPFTSTIPSSAPPTISALSSPPFASSSEISKWGIDDTPFQSSKSFEITRNKTRKSFFDTEEFDGCGREDGCKLLKKAEFVRLDLEIGLFSDPKEDLDLELRLGYS